MSKLNMSNWAQGQSEESPLTLAYILLFVRTIKANSPNTDIDFYCDQVTHDSVDPFVRENCNMLVVLDQFNNHERHEWALVKMKIFGLIQDDEMLHLDYDVVLRTDVDKVLEVIRDSGKDIVYQRKETIFIKPNYYLDHIRANPECKDMFITKDENGKVTAMAEKVAFNGGVTYFKTKGIRDAFVGDLDFYSKDFGTYISIEQLVIPNKLQKLGYSVGVLAEMLSGFDMVGKTFQSSEALGDREYSNLCKCGVFLQKIGLYHFLGDLKRVGGMLAVAQRVSNLPELD